MLITVLPSLVSNIFAYYRVSGIVEEETGNNKLQYLNQTINTLEILLNRIKENSNLLALNRSFISFENFPNGAYYEGLQGAIPEEDLPALYAYLEAKKNTFLTMNSFKLSDQFVDSVYFYDSSKDIVITSDNDRSNRQFRRRTSMIKTGMTPCRTYRLILSSWTLGPRNNILRERRTSYP